MVLTKTQAMKDFWSERARQYGADPRANTNDIWLRDIEIGHVQKRLSETGAREVMDFGCANGFTTIQLAEGNPGVTFLGVDINADMIAEATKQAEALGVPNVSFKVADIRHDSLGRDFDFIFTVRVFQNMESADVQRDVFDAVLPLLRKGGHLLLVETYAQRYEDFNKDRVKLGLDPLPIHAHLTLLPESFDDYAASKIELLENISLSSTYYLVTRLLYSYIAKAEGEEIDYNHPIHQVGALLPQVGEYGPQKATFYRKAG